MGNDHYGSLSSSPTNELCNVNSVNSDIEDQTPLLRHSRSSTFTRTLSNGSNKSATDSNLKVKCPTCQGKGRLSQSEWLIPFHFVNPGSPSVLCFLFIQDKYFIYFVTCVYVSGVRNVNFLENFAYLPNG